MSPARRCRQPRWCCGSLATVQRGETFGLTDGDVIAGSAGADIGRVPWRLASSSRRTCGTVRRPGWFLDQRANRMLVGAMADGLDVLDVFAADGRIQRARRRRRRPVGAQRRSVGTDAWPQRRATWNGIGRSPAVRACAHDDPGRRRIRGDVRSRSAGPALRLGGRRSAVVRPAPVERGRGAAGLHAPDPSRRPARRPGWRARAGVVLEPGAPRALLRDRRERREPRPVVRCGRSPAPATTSTTRSRSRRATI